MMGRGRKAPSFSFAFFLFPALFERNVWFQYISIERKGIFLVLENCFAAGMGQVTAILFLGIEKALMGGAHQSLYQYLMFWLA